MSIQKHLLKMLLIGLPAIWLSVVAITMVALWQKMSELGDTELVQFAQYLAKHNPNNANAFTQLDSNLEEGHSDDDAMGFAIWSKNGQLLTSDDNGRQFMFSKLAGFFEEPITYQNIWDERWRYFYLDNNDTVIAVGHNLESRNQVILTTLSVQLVTMGGGLVLFLWFVWWSIRQSFRPLKELGQHLQSRDPHDRTPIENTVPDEIYPLIESLNRWFIKVSDTLAREERFTADASHELRSPLTALTLQADMLERAILMSNLSEKDETALLVYSTQIKAGIDHTHHLVGQLLTLAKLRPSESLNSNQLEMIDWHTLSNSILSHVNISARQKHSQLKRTISDSPLPLLGNVVLIELLLRNLLDNAIRYCPPHSTIELIIAKDFISIEDNGQGVKDDDLKRLTERFFRPAGQNEQGSGLGLAIAKQIADLHGLSLNLENIQENGRVCGFKVSLYKNSDSHHTA